MNIQQRAKGLVGKNVAVRHKDGKIYHGVLHSVTDDGIIVRPLGPVHAAANADELVVQHADASIQQEANSAPDDVNAAPVWFAAWWLIAWALILGLWAAAWGSWGYRAGGYAPGYRAVVPRYGVTRRVYW
ncbi:LSm family protein [Effusibacillus dendaii]|uniref:DUF2642 domain-containing protein n=1 Tax=Effusibacillus dendaii TaxID=2743772 RepID=A0A7I8DIT4_9BACL|nr:hypothetical protein [Effusibacillus dendaii]BCJ88570.1 hypothetical protein skT53_35550 [Effusibacillus dendaii]